MPIVESMHTIFFDIDDTLVDYKAAERAAALVFYQDHMDHDRETPDAFIARWQAVTEKHFQRYLSGELSFQGQRRTRLREIFAADRALADSDADQMFARSGLTGMPSVAPRTWPAFRRCWISGHLFNHGTDDVSGLSVPQQRSVRHAHDSPTQMT